MTREEAIFCEKSYRGETNCTDCKYYGTNTCQSRESHRMAIKALEQEPCEDCISRKHIQDKYKTCADMLHEDAAIVMEWVNDAPLVIPAEKVGRWVPVSERLPEVGSEVLVCFDFKGNRSVYISNFYGDGEFHGLDDEYLTSEGRKYRKAVAWMSLPEPYTAEGGDNE